jgi:predicted AlkP superfamily pyrophosphatase or phosphodiesterase
MKRTLVLDVAGLGADLVAEMPALGRLAGRGALLPLEPVLPATTCPMQATLTTGEPPARHGIISSGLYFHDTAEVRFWEQSARLVLTPRVWDLPMRSAECGVRSEKKKAPHPRNPQSAISPAVALAKAGRNPQSKVAMLFWQQSLYGTADVILTPKPVHGPRGELVQDCWSRPADLYGRLAESLGPFDLMHYWGPMAGLGSSRWIADAALEVWRTERPDLALVYLPHLDYSGHRAGPASDAHREAARELDALLAPLLAAAEEDGARVIVLSEYSFVPVRRPVAPNRALREAGFLAVREVAGAEHLHAGDSRAFAMVDNQVAHVYFPASADLERDVRKVRAILEGVDGVGAVLDREALGAAGLDHVRSGELVALAEPDAHFTYYWWLDDAKAPPFARTVDIHAKPGFDAAELFVDQATKAIPLSAERVRGSHGLVPDDGAGWAVFCTSDPTKELIGRRSIRAVEVAHLMAPGVGR